jgi:hypothetical protein
MERIHWFVRNGGIEPLTGCSSMSNEWEFETWSDKYLAKLQRKGYPLFSSGEARGSKPATEAVVQTLSGTGGTI